MNFRTNGGSYATDPIAGRAMTVRVRRVPVREEVGLSVTFTIQNPGGAVQDITDWSFAAVFTRQAGTVDFELGMATFPAEGFAIHDGAAGQYTMIIAPETLQDVTDTTGDFTLFGSIIGTDPDAFNHLIEDLQLLVSRNPGT